MGAVDGWGRLGWVGLGWVGWVGGWVGRTTGVDFLEGVKDELDVGGWVGGRPAFFGGLDADLVDGAFVCLGGWVGE